MTNQADHGIDGHRDRDRADCGVWGCNADDIDQQRHRQDRSAAADQPQGSERAQARACGVGQEDRQVVLDSPATRPVSCKASQCESRLTLGSHQRSRPMLCPESAEPLSWTRRKGAAYLQATAHERRCSIRWPGRSRPSLSPNAPPVPASATLLANSRTDGHLRAGRYRMCTRHWMRGRERPRLLSRYHGLRT
jgi:hypothetical protein